MRVVVASGKGGTGKTMVALGLASAAAAAGDGASLVDCDVEEPDCHLFLGGEGKLVEEVTIPVARVVAADCTLCGECARVCTYKALAVLPKSVMVFDQLCHGCGACAIACPEDAIAELPRRIGEVRRLETGALSLMWGSLDVGEALATPVIRRLKSLAPKGGMQVIDSPPGTACPVVETVRGADVCILVAEPTPFGLNDLKLAVATVRQLDVPLAAVVNRDRGSGGPLYDFLKRQHIEVLDRVPDSLDIAHAYSRGVVPSEELPWLADRFKALLGRIQGRDRA
jgi:MinD superfamily P-loop ATPase